MRKMVPRRQALVSTGLSSSSAGLGVPGVLPADSGTLPARPLSGRQGPALSGLGVQGTPTGGVPASPPAIPFLGVRPFVGVRQGLITDTGGGKGAVSGGTMSPRGGGGRRAWMWSGVSAEELKVKSGHGGGGHSVRLCPHTERRLAHRHTEGRPREDTEGRPPHAKEGSEEPLHAWWRSGCRTGRGSSEAASAPASVTGPRNREGPSGTQQSGWSTRLSWPCPGCTPSSQGQGCVLDLPSPRRG